MVWALKTMTRRVVSSLQSTHHTMVRYQLDCLLANLYKQEVKALLQSVAAFPRRELIATFPTNDTTLSCAVVNVYVPNSGEGLKRLDYRVGSWDVAFGDYLASLGEKKPVILTGDLNCAHQEIDIHDPKRNLRSAGFTKVAILPPMMFASELALMLPGRYLLPERCLTVIKEFSGCGPGRAGVLQRAAPAEGIKGRVQGDLSRCCWVHLLEL